MGVSAARKSPRRMMQSDSRTMTASYLNNRSMTGFQDAISSIFLASAACSLCPYTRWVSTCGTPPALGAVMAALIMRRAASTTFRLRAWSWGENCGQSFM